MAPPSSPASPLHASFDPDVNDTAVFQDIPSTCTAPGERTTIMDLVEGEERFGAHAVEMEHGMWVEDTVDTRFFHGEAEAQGVDIPDALNGLGSDALPVIADAMRRARWAQTRNQILASVREIAVAPPPYAFPANTLRIRCPPLGKYQVSDSTTGLDVDEWVFNFGHDLGTGLIAITLREAHNAELKLRAHLREAVQENVACLTSLRDLARAVFKLNDISFLANGPDYAQGARILSPQALSLWIATKMALVVDHMLAALEAEGAYHGAMPIAYPSYNVQDAQRIMDRFSALIERSVSFHEYLASYTGFTGVLLKHDYGELKAKKLMLHGAVRKDGTTRYTGWQPGCTKYNQGDAQDTANDRIDDDMLALLPTVQNMYSPKDYKATVPRLNAPASVVHNNKLKRAVRELAQQYMALSNLLRSCTADSTTNYWADLPNIVQLDPSHSNPRSILIFKCAWLIIMQADKLMNVLLKHEKKGWLSGGDSEALGTWLERMSKRAVNCQIDAAREALRYAEVKQRERYWGFEGIGKKGEDGGKGEQGGKKGDKGKEKAAEDVEMSDD